MKIYANNIWTLVEAMNTEQKRCEFTFSICRKTRTLDLPIRLKYLKTQIQNLGSTSSRRQKGLENTQGQKGLENTQGLQIQKLAQKLMVQMKY